MVTSNIPNEKLEQLAEVLKNARLKKEYTTRKLAEICKIASHSEISMLENARRQKPDPLILRVLAEALDLNYADLFVMIGYIDEDIQPSIKPYLVPLDQEIKVYGSVSAGVGEVVFGEFIKTIYLPYCGKNCAGFVVNGDSMEPRIPDNSIVVVNTDIKELENRNVGIFLINGESFIKRVVKQNGKEYLVSDNPKYDPIFIDQHDEVTIVGKVIKLVVEDFI